jgi:alpha-beta hydrolase superfamily lysophospholipase
MIPRLSIPVSLLALVLAGGCKISDPVDLQAVAAATPWYVSADPTTTRSVAEYEAADGSVLGYVAHRGPGTRSTALVYLHGIESHAGWFDKAADLLCARGYDVYCLDRRGSGINRENRGFASGQVDSYQTLFSDIHVFMEQVRARYSRVFLVGLSWGGKLAMCSALEHPQDQDGVVMITPGIAALVDGSFGTKVKGAISSVFQPDSLLPIPIETEMFTTNPEHLAWIENDPLRLHYASTRFFLESYALDDFLEERMAGNRLPLLLFLAGQDRIVDNPGVLAALRDGGEGSLEVVEYPDQTHSVQFDAPERLVQDMDAWLIRQP